MTETNLIPCLPESAPFTSEQRAYLNGFFAGLFSRGPSPEIGSNPVQPATPLTALTILFGSQTGNAENLARRIAKEAGKRGFAPVVHDLADYPASQLMNENRLLIVTSTYGDGEPPDNAKAFWTFLSGDTAPKLPQTTFSVCALGDTNYPKFCGFGRDLDARLETLGATRLHARVDCDLEYEEPFVKWLTESLANAGAVQSNPVRAEQDQIAPAVRIPNVAGPEAGAPRHSRSNPFPSALLVNRKLNAPGSAKDTRHFELSLEGSALVYEAGDALGVLPANCDALVEEILRTLGFSGNECVPDRDGTPAPLREALLHHHEITRIPQPLLKSVAEKSGDTDLLKITGPEANGELSKYLWGREIIDLLQAHPAARFTPEEFTGLLKKLPARLYSIASSVRMHPREVHLCVSVVRYDSLGRPRKGVCSTFLAERVPVGGAVPAFVHSNRNFRLPADGNTPVIMVGPGTGIAPFRAFLEERQAMGVRGRNWLFFGDQRSTTDFLYREQMETFKKNGLLTRFDTAWSRDQSEKIYVQHRMRENASELFDWLEAGAHLYVCGDANRMAKDVEAALCEIIQTVGGRSPDQAKEYLDRLRSEKRYQRDVY